MASRRNGSSIKIKDKLYYVISSLILTEFLRNLTHRVLAVATMVYWKLVGFTIW